MSCCRTSSCTCTSPSHDREVSAAHATRLGVGDDLGHAGACRQRQIVHSGEFKETPDSFLWQFLADRHGMRASMADENSTTELDEANAAMNKAIADYTPTATKELSAIAFNHIQECWGEFEVAYKIWEQAFAEAERRLKKKMGEAP
jgi:hypothetical protein